MLNTFWIICFIGLGFVIEMILRRAFLNKYLLTSPDPGLKSSTTAEKFSGLVAQILPDFIGLFFFFGGAYFAYTLFFWVDSPWVQLVFMAVLIAIASIRTILIVSKIIFSPANDHLRIVPLTNRSALLAHRLITWTSGYIIAGLMFAVVARRLGAELQTVRLMQLLLATLLIVLTGLAILKYRKQIHNYIAGTDSIDDDESSWGRRQFAKVWHILAFLYLGILWLLLLGDLADPEVKAGGAFILSFFVVPIWMVADQLIQWVVKYAMSTLRIHQERYEDENEPTEEELIQRERGRQLYLKIKTAARVAVCGAVIVWLASLWQIKIPFFSGLAKFLLDSIVILTAALVFWQFLNSWIERKIQESIPAGEEDEESEDEWGGAAKRGRAYTLLPMLRKFVGSVLAVMVTMTLLSSLGVDIGPLLAGAGVIGLAIGFGAQKLVADVFSGFFYLLDDAFRVGEYLTAGSVSGTVENITLRNVMLRHHRGMLQIIPHSELGAITNFMRGGIVVKFNLDFPYDAPIDKIRKIIKKVGQKMLDNEEYGKDFIRPVKSQGVREITNSVMTIRVKFTAQPGTHFVIRREAYRLITEALNAQDIYYAHRKVIVDVEEIGGGESEAIGPEQKKQIANAVGAAATQEIEEEQKATAGPTKADDPMG